MNLIIQSIIQNIYIFFFFSVGFGIVSGCQQGSGVTRSCDNTEQCCSLSCRCNDPQPHNPSRSCNNQLSTLSPQVFFGAAIKNPAFGAILFICLRYRASGHFCIICYQSTTEHPHLLHAATDRAYEEKEVTSSS